MERFVYRQDVIRIMLGIAMIFIATQIGYATVCYQETANVSAGCGDAATGKYTTLSNGVYIGYFYVNYTKPLLVNVNSSWQVKHGTSAMYNITLPASCWSAYTDKIVLQIDSYQAIGVASHTQPYCYDGSSWQTVGTINTGATGVEGDCNNVVPASRIWDGDWATNSRHTVNNCWENQDGPASRDIYEEAMWWDYNASSLTTNWDAYTPANNSIVNNGAETQTYLFNFTGVSATTANCTFFFNGTSTETKNNLVNNTVYNFTITKNAAYVYNISNYINCNASNGLTANTSVKVTRWNLTQSVASNLSNYQTNGINKNFNVNVSFVAVGNPSTCTVLTSNASAVTCTYDYQVNTLLNYTAITCTVGADVQQNITYTPSCNASTTVLNGTAYSVFTDRVIPTMTFTSNVTGKLYLFQNTTTNVTMYDANLFRYNVSIDGVTYSSKNNIGYATYLYNYTKSPKDVGSGTHRIFFEVSDGHTANIIGNYDVKIGGFFTANSLTFKTTTKNEISIEPMEKQITDTFRYEKEFDRYTFQYEPDIGIERYDIKLADSKDGGVLEGAKLIIEEGKNEPLKVSFKVTSKEQIYIVNKPETKYKMWLVSGKNWIDFYSEQPEVSNEKVNYYYDLSDTSFKTVIAEVYYTGDFSKPISFSSIGDLNIYNITMDYDVLNFTSVYTTPAVENSLQTFSLNANTSGYTLFDYNDVNATFMYNNTAYDVTKYVTGGVLYFSVANVLSPYVNADSNIAFYWNLTSKEGEKYQWEFNQSVTTAKIGTNCTVTSFTTALQICGYDEMMYNTSITDMKLNVNFDLLSSSNEVVKKFGFAFDNDSCYDICISPNTSTYKVNSKMEFGDGDYTDRKYYLVNYTLTNVSQNISLFLLNDTLASDIILTVYDKSNGQRIEGAYVKILRYYPEQDNDTTAAYKVVEIERTDENGMTLGKMILADVWYKFIVEYPYGTTILDTEVQKILSTTKLLPVTLATGNLLHWNAITEMNTNLTCDKATQKCVYIWNNPSNTDVTATMKIYEDTGLKLLPYYETSLTSATGTIVYIIPTNISGKLMKVQGWITK